MTEVHLIFPAVSDDEVAHGLYRLTEAIALNVPDAELSAGFLGGEYGYGAWYENDVFMMHPFCWCDRQDCAWCRGCWCPDEATAYYVGGERVDFDAWVEAPLDARRLERVEEFSCEYCKGLVKREPNFRHKASGTEVEWYKYIGRGMEVDVRGDWDLILRECMESLIRGAA